MQKPEVGDIYKVLKYKDFGFENVIEILRIEGDLAFYRISGFSNDEFISPWNFVKYPDGVDRKLSSLEIELL
jgi:hypothetical protein